jgi:hypothetical protein
MQGLCRISIRVYSFGPDLMVTSSCLLGLLVAAGQTRAPVLITILGLWSIFASGRLAVHLESTYNLQFALLCYFLYLCKLCLQQSIACYLLRTQCMHITLLTTWRDSCHLVFWASDGDIESAIAP